MAVKIKQRDITDCGAACIASVASYYNLHLTIPFIRQLASTDKKGTNILGLTEALQKIGFDAKGVRGQMDSLKKIPKPAIAHVIVRKQLHHFVVISSVNDLSVEIMDPADGKLHRLGFDAFIKSWTGILIILLPGEKFKTGNYTISPFKRLFQLIAPHWKEVTLAVLGSMVYTFIGLSTSVYVQKIVDTVLISGNANALNIMGMAMLGLLMIQGVIFIIKNRLILKTGQAIDQSLILGYSRHLLKLPQLFFDSMRTGEIISRVNDAVKIRTFVNEGTAAVAVNVFILIFSLGLIFTHYWKLAMIIFLVMPLYAIIYLLTNKFNRSLERQMMEQSAALESHLVEFVGSMSTVRHLNMADVIARKTNEKFSQLLKTVRRSGINSIFSAASSDFISRLLTIILLWVGAIFVLEHKITTGELVSFFTLTTYFTAPVVSLIGLNKMIQTALISSDRLFEILDLESEGTGGEIKLNSKDELNIVFDKVDFRYGSRPKVLSGISLAIEGGKITAIAGESGSGKSTLVGILQKFYPIQAGKISIAGHDVADIQTESLRNIISVVPQKIELFAGSIATNIAPADAQPDIAKILSLCTSLGMKEFIDELPYGLDTVTGEMGATLSGGQQQRIAIARALYKPHKILILDEATSSLDTISEDYVHRMLQVLKEQKTTVILITHRLSTLLQADKIIMIEDGTVAEQGTHQELFSQKGAYRKLWKYYFPEINSMPPASSPATH